MNKKDRRNKREKEKFEKLLARYNQCRDLELDRFWKNSVFVWVFLALCFTALGTVFTEYSRIDCKRRIDKETCETVLPIIAFCGLFISKIWTWMARGLKAWYEVFEVAVWDMETKSNVLGYNRQHTVENYWTAKQNGINPFNSKPYSPTRIVILIGHLLSVIWLVLFLRFLYVSCNCVMPFEVSGNYFWSIGAWVISITILIILTLFRLKPKHYGWYIGGCILVMSILVLLLFVMNCTIKSDLDICFNYWLTLVLCLFIVMVICPFLVRSTTLRDDDENKIFANIRLKLRENTQGIPRDLYFEVKDWRIKFFFDNSSTKSFYRTTLQKLCEGTVVNKKPKWFKRIDLFFRNKPITDNDYTLTFDINTLNNIESKNKKDNK